jgi:hypothetical protein
MTRDLDMSHETDDLGALTGHARAALGDDIADELRFVAPDFAAVVEAAHARDPRRVPFAALVEAQDLAPVVPLADSSPRLSARQSAEFIALLADARAEIDAATPVARPTSAPVPPNRWSRRWLWGLAAAAAVLLAVSAQSILATRQAPNPDAANQAPWWERADDTAREAEHLSPEPAPRPTREPRKSPDPEPTPEVEPEPASTPEPAITPEPDLVEPVQKTSKRPPRETLADKLRRLDAEAESAWQSGDVATAELRYREIIKLAPGSRAADLGYGDLFALSRQRSGPDAEEALWREYLAAFPRGRYADDARAGLCRRARADARGACWQQYLADFPNGVHRTQATRALAQ